MHTMRVLESFSSLLGKKDKAKTPPAKAETAPSAEAEKMPTDQELIADGLILVEKIFANAEKHKNEPAGMVFLHAVESILNILEAAKAGDPGALEKLRRAYLTPEERGAETKESISLPEAAEIMGSDFHGPEAVEKTFGVKIPESEIPPIPFSSEDLERAKELGQMLILRIDRGKDGKPLTMKSMNELLQDKFTKEEKGNVLADSGGWKKDEDFFKKETPEQRWALVSKDIIPDSTSKYYLKQTGQIADYLIKTVFAGKEIPDEYAEATQEFNDQKENIAELMRTDWQKSAEQLAKLKINQLCRQTPAETLYDILIHFQTSKKRLLENRCNWTNCRNSDGELVLVGGFDSEGARVFRSRPDNSRGYLGVSFSRVL